MNAVYVICRQVKIEVANLEMCFFLGHEAIFIVYNKYYIANKINKKLKI